MDLNSTNGDERTGDLGDNQEAWVQRFVSNGGSTEEGRTLYAKMRVAQKSSNPQQNPAITDQRIRLSQPGTPMSPDQQPDSDDGRPADPSPSLFSEGDLPPDAPATAPKATLPAVKAAPKRPGRKGIAFDQMQPTQQELDLFHLSMEIEENDAREVGKIGYVATAMIYAALPYTEVEGAMFKRTTEYFTLRIMNDPELGIPYGKVPRLITAYLCSEAKRKKDMGGLIELGRSQKEFMERLGMNSRGGARGDIARFNKQSRALFTSSITLLGAPNTELHWNHVHISKKGMLLWNPHRPEERSQWQSTIQLDKEFFEECINHPVPIDLRVIHSLTSPLAIDIYLWLTYRFNAVRVPTPVSWKQLKWQFDATYADTAEGMRDFKKLFKKQLRAVLAVYRQANLDVKDEGVWLLPSRTHIPPLPKS